ncbi:hypothetical protein PV08_09230 [Exophiala spinifera]|uniref:Uncharacterized protein n=1 Tax=Exophiala spinifera TaxID=91928 RepID=A0A0D1YAJ7_9EURO|nr:uncharacterized protein PV08_09230 [Exophiala spinifera]KIW11956.1 hypothetical protein PV08_09230 [Exophiala spinifera]
MNCLVCTTYTSIVDLLNALLSRHDASTDTDLIVCSTRAEFLHEVLAQLDHQHASAAEPGNDDGDLDLPDSRHALLSPTLSLLSASQHCRLVFCPTITTLRGYLSSYSARVSHIGVSNRHCQIMIVNLLRQHSGTAEFTLQGLSHTFASAVSAAHTTRRPLRLVELQDTGDHPDPNQGPGLWSAQVPLLNTAIKIGEGGTAWGRRTISVEKVASRWFRRESE